MAWAACHRITAAKFEVSGIEGASVPAFFPARMDSINQFSGELVGGHPHTGADSGVFRCILGLQPCFPYIHYLPPCTHSRQMLSSPPSVASFGRDYSNLSAGRAPGIRGWRE